MEILRERSARTRHSRRNEDKSIATLVNTVMKTETFSDERAVFE